MVKLYKVEAVERGESGATTALPPEAGGECIRETRGVGVDTCTKAPR